MADRPRRLLAEFLGTLLLVAIVVGSGIAAERLSPEDAGLQLLETALATALGLGVVIAVLQPVSGAHLNPVISLADAVLGRRGVADALAYLPAQLAGAAGGSVLANLMFGLPPIEISTTARLTVPHALAEVVATAGLVLVVVVLVRTGRPGLVAPAVGAYIGSAYFFTSSTSFANPAVTAGRMLTDSLAGIHPLSALGFVAAQLVGGVVGLVLVRMLTASVASRTDGGQSLSS